MSKSQGDDKPVSKDGSEESQQPPSNNILHFQPAPPREFRSGENAVGDMHEPYGQPSDASKPEVRGKKTANSETSSIVSIFSGSELGDACAKAIVAIHPENRGLKMVYRHSEHERRSVAVPILCWGLREDGEVVALVPWIKELLDCASIAERFDILWEGFYDAASGDIFEQPPAYIPALLHAERQQLQAPQPKADSKAANPVQEIPDHIGTHAMLVQHDKEVLTLTAVVSWKLNANGSLEGMIADESQPHKYPILAGDSCLHAASASNDFRSYFQRDIAEQIRARDPDTLDAIERLFI